jgi:hypothetical protein
VPAAPAGDLSVTLGVRAERGDYHSELSGFLALAVPLDRFAAPRAATAVAEAPAPAAPTEDLAEEPPKGGRRSAPPPTPRFTPRQLSHLAREALAAALRAQRLPERAAELDSLSARARSSALLPELRLRAARAQDESLRLTPTQDDPYRFTQDGGDDLVFEARATWKLDRLVFADEEIAVGRLALERERAAERLGMRIAELVLAWHHAVSAAPSGDDSSRSRAEFERLAAEVSLDVATGGWFGPHAERVLRAAPEAAPRPSKAPAPGDSGGARQTTPRGPSPPDPLVEGGGSATPAGPCLPMHVTASKTFCGVSMR